MTTSQKLAIRSSEIRQRLNEIAGMETDAVTDAIRTESEGLRTELARTETQYRAALTTEGVEESRAAGDFDNGDGEPAEVRALLSRVRLADYLSPAGAGSGITGGAAELSAALGLPLSGPSGGVAVPWRVLAGPEHRAAPEARAFTTTGQHDGPTMNRPILQRLFGPGIADTLGVRIDSVPVGMTEWPLIATGVAPDEKAEGTAAGAAVASTFTIAALKPKRLTGRYEFTHEIAASVPDIEAALRRDLADAVRSRMQAEIIDGNNVAPRVRGFATAIGAPDDAAATGVYADYAAPMPLRSTASTPRWKARFRPSSALRSTSTRRACIRRARASRFRGASTARHAPAWLPVCWGGGEHRPAQGEFLPRWRRQRRLDARRQRCGRVADAGSGQGHLLEGESGCGADVGFHVGRLHRAARRRLRTVGVQGHLTDGP